MLAHVNLSRIVLFSVIFSFMMIASLILSEERVDYENLDPHFDFKVNGNCFKCHELQEAEKEGKKIRELSPDMFRVDLPDYCHACHSIESLGNSHPIGIDPFDKYWKLKLPEDFFLDVENKMTCITCHTGHGKFLTTSRIKPVQEPYNKDKAIDEPYYYRTYYLRRSDPSEGFDPLCETCHQDL